MPVRILSTNSVSLAGEFAVLSQLALRGYDANMTLGRTKGVDILVSDPRTLRMFQLEVKTNYREWENLRKSEIFGTIVSDWRMTKKNESATAPNLYYCFVNISRKTNLFKFYIVPSDIVARHVRETHALWLSESRKAGKNPKDTDIRAFRIGVRGEKYKVSNATRAIRK